MIQAPASRALITAPAIVAIAALALNDHVLKAAWPGWWTGKLSDVAGLAVFPLLVCAAIELALARPVGRRGVIAVASATGLAFAAFKLSPLAGELYRHGLAALQWPFRAITAIAHGDAAPALGRAHLTQDATDLLALPALAVSIWLVARETRQREFRYRA